MNIKVLKPEITVSNNSISSTALGNLYPEQIIKYSIKMTLKEAEEGL
jgi:hypothetical protein